MLGFTVTEEAKELLANVKERIGIIAVAGKYRTGKSFLLNRIILGKAEGDKGFGVGPTINPCTKASHFNVTVNRAFGSGPSH